MNSTAVTPSTFPYQVLSMLDRPGPRYTSYPTADRFVDAVDASVYEDALHAREVGGLRRPLSLYVHVPFCESVCYYCACNKIVTRAKHKSVPYLHALFSEIDMLKDRLKGQSPIVQLHLGGGTPTFLSDDQLESLVYKLEQSFQFVEHTERSIEVDPRTVDSGRLARLREMGFNRLSFGIQDFNPLVQKAIHRIQSPREVRDLMLAARALAFSSVNIDLMYGLPEQTRQTFEATLQSVIELSPDRIALYAYAHMPERFKQQRRINEADLLVGAERSALLELAIKTLCAAGYVYIGMDHFAKASDSLAVAKRQGRLHRNFQGYTNFPECDLMGIGVSAISQVGAVFAQNERTLDEYYQKISRRQLPTLKGYVCDADDLIRRSIIMSLMCQGFVCFSDVEQTHWIRFRDYFKQELIELAQMQEQGLVLIHPDSIEVTAAGWYVVRAIAMVFDRFIRQTRERHGYSRML